MAIQTALMKLPNSNHKEMRVRIGMEHSQRMLSGNLLTQRSVTEFAKKKFNSSDITFEQLSQVKLLPEVITITNKYKNETKETIFPTTHYPALRRNM